MALHHLIVSSIKQLVNSQPRLTAALPGDLHYGKADALTNRPFGSLTVVEHDREYNSGGGSLVNYLVTLKLYGKQKARTVGELLQDFATLLNGTRSLPTIPDELADVVSIIPTGGPMGEDDAEEYGKDCVTGQASWAILINESETALAE